LRSPSFRMQPIVLAEMVSTIPRAITARTQSLRVQCVNGVGGVSQATAIIWQTCSAVKVQGLPGRGESAKMEQIVLNRGLRLPAALSSSGCSVSQRFRHKATVSGYRLSASPMVLLPCPEEAAAKTICARCTVLWGNSRL